MARSTKKPYYADQNTKAKRVANSKVRQHLKKDELADGKSYRKVGDTYSIRDWSFHAPNDKKAKRK
jgi:hypothetical protein